MNYFSNPSFRVKKRKKEKMTRTVLCMQMFYNPFQNYRRVGFLKYFKFGWNFLRIVFGILLRTAPQLLSYSF